GQIYLGSSVAATIASLCCFNVENLEFPHIGCYRTGIHPAREVYSQELAPLDYYLLGDIMIPLGPLDSISLRTHATVNVCGIPSNINKEN
ncbi:hypothetical protein R3P38DRAFT_2435320, partial [Favolaschia claudopus]